VLVVANKVVAAADERLVADFVREPVFASIPADPKVGAAERVGAALIEYAAGSPVVQAIASLAPRLERVGLGP
jgi:hypothetical protein